MIIFLDFDGVLHHENVTLKRCHPIKRRHLSEHERRFLTRDGKLARGKNLFEHADRLATALESFPDVKIVISSTWREHFRPDALLRFLPPSLADRVIGHTPFCSQSSEDGTRLCEVELYMEGNGLAGEPWIALDDQARLFLDDDLIPSDNLFLLKGDEGFTDDMAVVFGDFLRAKVTALTDQDRVLERRIKATIEAGDMAAIEKCLNELGTPKREAAQAAKAAKSEAERDPHIKRYDAIVELLEQGKKALEMRKDQTRKELDRD